MFFELSKFLNFFLISPISWIFLLLISFCLCKKKTLEKDIPGQQYRHIYNFHQQGIGGLCKVSNCKTIAVAPEKRYKLAIVMGGFASMNRETGQMRYEQDRADRLWEAVRLWRNGTIEKILITGDGTSIVQPDGTSTEKLFLQYMEEMGIPQKVFILEKQALNTRQNALFTAEILKKENIKGEECLLITSATHMKRSLACFKKTGIHPDYFPVNTYDTPKIINHRTFYPQWEAAIEWQELMNEWIGDRVYQIMGYI